MKKLLFTMLSASVMLITAHAQNVGIGTTNPLERLSVGSTSQFRVDANGNITRINNLPYSFPSVQGGANQFLRNDGSGNLTWASAGSSGPKPVVRAFSLVNNAGGATDWAIDNASDYHASPFNLDPTLVLYRGLTYDFNVSGGHPFTISATDNGPAYTVGITGSNPNPGSGTLKFTVPMDAPDTMYYYCSAHPATMKGLLVIR